jgi:hypothetical protein
MAPLSRPRRPALRQSPQHPRVPGRARRPHPGSGAREERAPCRAGQRTAAGGRGRRLRPGWPGGRRRGPGRWARDPGAVRARKPTSGCQPSAPTPPAGEAETPLSRRPLGSPRASPSPPPPPARHKAARPRRPDARPDFRGSPGPRPASPPRPTTDDAPPGGGGSCVGPEGGRPRPEELPRSSAPTPRPGRTRSRGPGARRPTETFSRAPRPHAPLSRPLTSGSAVYTLGGALARGSGASRAGRPGAGGWSCCWPRGDGGAPGGFGGAGGGCSIFPGRSRRGSNAQTQVGHSLHCWHSTGVT